MAITVQLPPEVEQRLRAQTQDLDTVAKEAMLVELYRQDRLTQRELAEALGLARLQVDDVLKRHGVTEDLWTANEYADALEHLRKKA